MPWIIPCHFSKIVNDDSKSIICLHVHRQSAMPRWPAPAGHKGIPLVGVHRGWYLAGLTAVRSNIGRFGWNQSVQGCHQGARLGISFLTWWNSGNRVQYFSNSNSLIIWWSWSHRLFPLRYTLTAIYLELNGILLNWRLNLIESLIELENHPVSTLATNLNCLEPKLY